MSTKVDTSRFRWRATSISGLWPDTLSATRCAQSRLASGGMAVVKLVATLSSYRRRAVVVGGVADRYASELARAGQSNRRRAGTGSASPQRATRPPLWPAGTAEGNRQTFGPRVGLSSHRSPAKGGPKSKCLARVKIARTSAGPPSLTISDPSRSRFWKHRLERATYEAERAERQYRAVEPENRLVAQLGATLGGSDAESTRSRRGI